jgi:hypothetical protein
MSAGGNRSWSEEEVRLTISVKSAIANIVSGELSSSDPHAEDAIQAHCCTPQED